MDYLSPLQYYVDTLLYYIHQNSQVQDFANPLAHEISKVRKYDYILLNIEHPFCHRFPAVTAVVY